VEWETRHRDFHAALIANCRSHWLMEFCARLSDHAYLYRQLSRLFGDATRNEAAEHETIMQHALSGDTEAAVAALMWHYQMTFDLCRKAINAGESGGYPPTPPSAPSPPHRQ
jgi:DNA-binding GntR family transcriptional regulator